MHLAHQIFFAKINLIVARCILVSFTAIVWACHAMLPNWMEHSLLNDCHSFCELCYYTNWGSSCIFTAFAGMWQLRKEKQIVSNRKQKYLEYADYLLGTMYSSNSCSPRKSGMSHTFYSAGELLEAIIVTCIGNLL